MRGRVVPQMDVHLCYILDVFCPPPTHDHGDHEAELAQNEAKATNLIMNMAER